MTVEYTRLSSGLTVVTQNMPHIESVAIGTWIKSGSRNELVNEHGIAHLLEHMAFKGTSTIGTSDNAREARVLAAQDEVFAELTRIRDSPISTAAGAARRHACNLGRRLAVAGCGRISAESACR